jgi:hypothetical protein
VRHRVADYLVKHRITEVKRARLAHGFYNVIARIAQGLKVGDGSRGHCGVLSPWITERSASHAHKFGQPLGVGRWRIFLALGVA